MKDIYIGISLALIIPAVYVAWMCVPGAIIWLIYNGVICPSFPNMVHVSGWVIGGPLLGSLAIVGNGFIATILKD